MSNKSTAAQKIQYPSELIDLPSGGKLYNENSPLRSGQVEIKYMTAREEDILTSQNLIKKGVVVDKLLESLILTDGVELNDLLLGDKNAVMVAARILAYGSEYTTQIIDPDTTEKIKFTFDLSECPFKELPDDIDYENGNEFKISLPASKKEVTFKILNGYDDDSVNKQIKTITAKLKNNVSPEVTTRLKQAIISIDGNEDRGFINNFVDNMLSRDSLALRNEIARISPDIVMEQIIELGGRTVPVDIPLAVEFFWPHGKP